NESILRRAFAYAFDKTEVTTDILDGFSQEHDSLVPFTNGWCVEDQFAYHYYTDQSTIGNDLLNASGDFEINPSTGFREYKGQPFDIQIEYPSTSPEIAGGVAQIGVDALTRLHINAEIISVDYYEMRSRIDAHGDYDVVFDAERFDDYDVDWLAYDYWSDYADVEYQNPSNFENMTYDFWRDQLLYGTTYEEVHDASTEMQKILQYNVPRLVVYENTYMQGYRNDVYTGHTEDLGSYITGQWTMRKIHKIDESPGGTLPVAIGQEPDSFNHFITDAKESKTILSNLYSSLFKRGPDLNPWPDLAVNLLTETHDTNTGIPEGHTRYTIDIIQNATWSDGTPLTADDVAFTFIYQFESAAYGNPLGLDLSDLVIAYAPTDYTAIIEFSTESYWTFSNFAFDYIIPEHIFNDDTGIGYEGWSTWNPIFDDSHPFVTSGPFIFTDFEYGEFFEISKNVDFYYAPEVSTTTTTTTTTTTITSTTTSTTGTTTSSTTTNTNSTGGDILGTITLMISLGSITVIIVVICLITKSQK
ncbi:MAG: ABC transporter substrate-binding protein, partial [Candidatus Thorarchaeota archaeon]